MSLGLGLDGRLAADAVDACDRLRQQLHDAAARHDHAASLARPDWEGPHRAAFEERFARVQRRFEDCEAYVLVLRRYAEGVLADACEQLREASAATSRNGGTW